MSCIPAAEVVAPFEVAVVVVSLGATHKHFPVVLEGVETRRHRHRTRLVVLPIQNWQSVLIAWSEQWSQWWQYTQEGNSNLLQLDCKRGLLPRLAEI